MLAVAQAFTACGVIVLFTFGGIVGARIAPVPALATLPLSLAIVGVALMTLPAAGLMQRFGRKPVFVGGALGGGVAALLGAVAIEERQFGLLCVAGALLGASQALGQQYRFAAAEYVPPELAGRAVGSVMTGTLVAAVLGPELADRARHLLGAVEFSGSFLALALLLAAAAVPLLLLAPPPALATESASGARPLRRIAAQPGFIVAVLAAISAYGVMSFIMTATPISMHVHHGFDVTEVKRVISAHVVAMYAPSLVSGWLTRRLGLTAMMVIGLISMAACIGIAAVVGHAFVHYLSGLVLLGLGWNLLFVAGTTLLTRTYTPAERFKTQGLNDFATFGTQACVSLLAGVAIQRLGWGGLNLASLPLLLAMGLALLWHKARGRSAPREPGAPRAVTRGA